MKKILTGILILGVLMVGILIVLAFALRGMEADFSQLAEYTYEDFALQGFNDGTYRGEFNRFPLVIAVDVVIVDEVVVSIFIVNHQTGQGTPAEVIVVPVIAQQSLNVDVIAGATYSSYGILLAIQDAIVEAHRA